MQRAKLKRDSTDHAEAYLKLLDPAGTSQPDDVLRTRLEHDVRDSTLSAADAGRFLP